MFVHCVLADVGLMMPYLRHLLQLLRTRNLSCPWQTGHKHNNNNIMRVSKCHMNVDRNILVRNILTKKVSIFKERKSMLCLIIVELSLRLSLSLSPSLLTNPVHLVYLSE